MKFVIYSFWKAFMTFAPPFATPHHPAGMRTPDMSRKSPISALGGNGRLSLSPVTSMSPTNFSPLPSPITQLTGTIIGACPEHMSGRSQGISCDKCDMIMQQSRQIGGQMAFMHSRNSCKTLKCPKCNWHYKYQETLEIHMKEKHPDSESNCIYCLTSQPHPRLARGETYTCGYKPYRCEVCNYSTTTKGNLSIHMQSDKHLNNMQELQNGGMPNVDNNVSHNQNQMQSLSQTSNSPTSVNGIPKVSTPSTSLTPPNHQKPKPMWRCDVCNYETNVARNLRIHMTSEKHTHNMMVLQQNVKHMQQMNAMPDPMALLQMSQNGMMHEKPPPPPEVAMADLAYNQALLIQMISGGNPMAGNMPNNPFNNPAPQEPMGPHFDLGINPDSLEPPPEPVPANPNSIYACCVCSNFDTDSLDQLNHHIQLDRSKLNENEVLLIVAGNYICKLCSYKTTLKANFQLHCKTDKHLQKLQYVNHILEGGPRNEWKLKYLANSNPLHVRCNLCEFYTNSVHKLQLHSAHQRHEVLTMLFKHLSASEHPIPIEKRQFRCCLCNFTTKSKLDLLHHIRSVQHLRMEQLHQLQRHAEGKGGTHQDIGDIFRIEEEDLDSSKEEIKSEEVDQKLCPHCSFMSDGAGSLTAHIETEHPDKTCNEDSNSENRFKAIKQNEKFSCPLCEESCENLPALEKHAFDSHSVNSEGLQRLLILVRLSHAAKQEVANNAAQAKKEDSNNQNDEKATGKDSLSFKEEMTNVNVTDSDNTFNPENIERRVKEEFRSNQDGGVGDEPRGRSETPHIQQRTSSPTATSTMSMVSPSERTSTPSFASGGNPGMAEMAAAINAITAAQMQQQMPFNPMLMAGLGLAGLPMSMNPLAAMNLQPPLAAAGLHHPLFDPVALANLANNQNQNNSNNSHANEFFMKQQQQHHIMQQQQQQAAAAAAAAAQQKRGRTRITDEQLKILRAHFDINNSPSEEQIADMAIKSGLMPKVIKHWFRNTLFKERQRCKDSPYNFSIPPCTTLNLEEYEKTGETKVSPLNPEEARDIMEMNRSKDNDDQKNHHLKTSQDIKPNPISLGSDITRIDRNIEETTNSNISDNIMVIENRNSSGSIYQNQNSNSHPSMSQSSPQLGVSGAQIVSSASCSPVASYQSTFPPLSSPQTSLSLSSLISSQLENNSLGNHPKLPQTPPHILAGLSHPGSCVSPTPSNLSYPTTPPGHNSASGKRANRTRFTDYQIKVLQEFFENNAYPKDDDLEYLSKLLNLSPRVIVVWFQNARQKARKVYENQPPIDPMEENAGRFTRTPGLNYQCKKCLLVFQRYYELIRHQKSHCFKEEDAKRSAQAQAAAAQAAALYTNDDNSNHSSVHENSSQSREMDVVKPLEDTYQCDKCSLVFNRFEQWREHQLVHLMNPTLFMKKNTDNMFPTMPSLPQHSPQSVVGIPQSTPPLSLPLSTQQSLSQFQQNQQQHQQQLPSPLLPPASPMKRKADESEDEHSNGGDQPRDKRLRTTILPEQLDYLYQKYQMEANPSRKMLETIAHEVGLKKRVVQVWFQNTRARERKGQFRAHAQVINKKCPFCPAIFKVKSALESHLSTKHSDQYSCGEINIDALPDLDDFTYGNYGGISSSNHPSQSPSMTQVPSLTMSSLFSPSERSQDTLSKYHEEAIRRYLTDVTLASNSVNQQGKENNMLNGDSNCGVGLGAGIPGFRKEGEQHPLDLSRPLELARTLGVNIAAAAAAAGNTSVAANFDNEFSSFDKMSDKMYGLDNMLSDDECYHIDVTESDENDAGNLSESDTTSPNAGANNNSKQNSAYKRFRTQLSSTQIKLMKSVFINYKTPTMTECEVFGNEIELPKRVIQVWFQNARAKEKKAKLALMKIMGKEPEPPKPASGCKVCNCQYDINNAIQDHVFTRSHIDNMRVFIEKQNEENKLKNSSAHPSGTNFLNTSNDDRSNYQFNNQFHPNNIQLHMAQLMALNAQNTGENNSSPHNFHGKNDRGINLNSSGESFKGSDQSSPSNISGKMNEVNDTNGPDSNNADFNRLQLLHKVYEQMGINNNSAIGAPNTNQHPLLQQPMIEG